MGLGKLHSRLTSAFTASLDRSDSYHATFKRLFASPPALVTSALVIAEGRLVSSTVRQASRGVVSCIRRCVARRENHMLGILVHGDNHFIVRGPLPDRTTALALVQHWSLIRIGAATPPALAQWSISTREFRENLQWAVIVQAETEVSPAVTQLLAELAARGITIHTVRR